MHSHFHDVINRWLLSSFWNVQVWNFEIKTCGMKFHISGMINFFYTRKNERYILMYILFIAKWDSLNGNKECKKELQVIISLNDN